MVDEIGYKLSKRKEKSRPNQLISFFDINNKPVQNLHLCEENYVVRIDMKNPKTVLDFVKNEVHWG